jgi:serine/threonine protein kinase
VAVIRFRYPFETEEQIMDEFPNYPSNRTISKHLKHLINSLLEKNPKIRMSILVLEKHQWLKEL